MFRRLLILAILLWSVTAHATAPLFELDNPWTTPIPGTPAVFSNSNEYVKGIIHSANGGMVWGAMGHTEYAPPVWQALVDTANVTVIMDSRNFVYLNSTNNTVEAQTNTGTPFNLMATTGDYLYVGDNIKINSVIFKLVTLGAGYTLSIQYSTGSGAWSNVAGLTDGTSNLSLSGCSVDCRIGFTLPSNWATDTVNGISGRYWLRIKTTSTPSVVATAYLIAYGDNDGEAVLRGWNIVPIPAGAKGAGQDERQCPYLPSYGSSFDGPLIIKSYDDAFIWEFYQAYNCSYYGVWHANTVRKWARTTNAAGQEIYVADGSGIMPVQDLGNGVYNQYDSMGSNWLCSASNITSGLITKADYISGTIAHALQFNYTGLGPTTQHYGYYPCLKAVSGTKSDITTGTTGDNSTCTTSSPCRYMSLGMRVQLIDYDCTTNISSATTGYLLMRMACEAMKTYGAIFVDISGSGKSIEGESGYGVSPDPWLGVPLPNNLLPNIPAANLQIVKPVCNDNRVCPDNYVASSVPNAPTNLTVADTNLDTGGSITLTWTKSSSTGVTSQRIYRGTTTGVYGTLVTTINDNTTQTIADNSTTNPSSPPIDGTTYYYVIRSYKSPNESVDSNEYSASSLDNTQPPEAPNAPSGLTVLDVTGDAGGSLVLSWTPSNSGTVTEQRIYRKTGTNPYSLLIQAITDIAASTYTDNTATLGVFFTYAIRAYNSAGESQNSNEVTGISLRDDSPLPSRSQVTRPTATRNTSTRSAVTR